MKYNPDKAYDEISQASISAGAAGLALKVAGKRSTYGLPRDSLARAKVHLLNALSRVEGLLDE